MQSWKTTVLGVATLVGIVARMITVGHADPADVTGALTAIGLIFAQDHAGAA